MYSLFFIAKNNLKKHKGEVAILFTLIFLAALLLFCSLSLMLSGPAAIEANDKKYHVSDLLIFTTTEMQENLPEAMAKIEAVEGSEMVESTPIVNLLGDYYTGNKTAEDAISYQFFIGDSSKPTYMNAIPEEFENLSDSEIVVPYFLKDTVKAGDKLYLKIAGEFKEFTVKGYLEHMYFATSMNISGYFCIVSHNDYTLIENNVTQDARGSFIYCKVAKGTDLDTYDKAVQHAFDGSETPGTVTRSLMDMATLAMAEIASAIVLLFTVILVGLALIIMHFSIKNFIEMNIQNIGLLQATGYSARALRFSCVMEEMLICGVATVSAIGVGCLITTPLNAIEGSLMGLSGFTGICIPALLSTLIGIPVAVFLGTLVASRSYKKLTVLESLRSGIQNHNFKKNHFALEKTSLPLDLALSGKQIFGRPKKNIFIALIIAVLTFSTLQGFTVYQNFALQQESLLKLVGFEAADIQCTLYEHPEIVSELEADPRVERTLLSSYLKNVEVRSATKSTSLGIDVYSDVDALQYEYMLEGRRPQKENEIVLTITNAKKLDVKLGDTVNVIAPKSEESVAYTVCGIDQKINNMGNKAMMCEEGALRIDPEHRFTDCMVYLKDGVSVKDFQKEWAATHPKDNFILVDDLIGSTIETLVSAMSAICVIFVVLTCFVVILTEILLTRSQIIRERSELGVSKAIGYTSGELIRRMIMSTLPVVVIGVLAGFLLQLLLNDKMMALGLSSFGIAQSNLTTHPLWFPLTMLIIVACAILTGFFCSKRISKLEPVRILKEE